MNPPACNRNRTFGRGSGAFTLVETLIAVALLVLLSVAVLGFLFDLRTQRQLLADMGSDLEVGSVLFERIERDLALCVAYDAERGAPGVVGDSASLTIVARRMWPDPDDPARGIRGMARTTYRFDAEAGTLSVDIDGSESVLSERVELFRVRYNDSGEPGVWRDGFDAVADGGLPMAVEVAVWFTPPGIRQREEPSEFDAMMAERMASEMAEAGMDEPPIREPDRWRIFAVPDAEPTGGRAAAGAGNGGSR